MNWNNNVFSLSGLWAFFAGGSFGLLTWAISPQSPVSSIWFAIVIFICSLSIWANGLLWKSLKNPIRFPLQTIRPIRFNFTRQGEIPSVLFEPNELLLNNVFVTLYLTKDDFDEYLATAKVIHIQDNRLIQAQILHLDKDEIPSELISSNAAYIRKIKVLPIVTDRFLHSSNLPSN